MFTFVNLWELSNNTLFDNIELPTGKYTATLPNGDLKDLEITPDKETLVSTILDEVAEYQPLSIDVDLMKFKINNFFKKNKEGFSRLIALNLVTYSPIENTDRYESSTDTYNRDSVITDTGTTTNKGEESKSSNSSVGENGTYTRHDNATDENKISAFDSSEYQPNNITTHDESISDTTTNSTTTNGNDSTITSGSSNDNNIHKDNIEDVNKHNLRTHGNIGVTTNQQMMTQEVDFWNSFNFYDMVANKFLFEMCLTCETYN